jgi:hypothetical protein
VGKPLDVNNLCSVSPSSYRDRWTFKNIPYAQPPLGDLRWARPQPPKKMEGVQGGSRRGPACLQAGVYGPNVLGDGNGSDLGKLVNQMSVMLNRRRTAMC